MTDADRTSLVRLADQVQRSRDRILAGLGLTWADAAARFLAPDPDSPSPRPRSIRAGYLPIETEPIRSPR